MSPRGTGESSQSGLAHPGWRKIGLHFMPLVLLGSMLSLPPAPADAQSVAGGSQAMSNASGLSAAGSGLVVEGSLQGIHGSAQMVVESIQRTGDVIVIVMRGVSDATVVSVQVAATSAAVSGLAVGASILVVAEATGYALMVGERLITYVPNEYGASMVHQSRHGETRK